MMPNNPNPQPIVDIRIGDIHARFYDSYVLRAVVVCMLIVLVGDFYPAFDPEWFLYLLKPIPADKMKYPDKLDDGKKEDPPALGK